MSGPNQNYGGQSGSNQMPPNYDGMGGSGGVPPNQRYPGGGGGYAYPGGAGFPGGRPGPYANRDYPGVPGSPAWFTVATTTIAEQLTTMASALTPVQNASGNYIVTSNGTAIALPAPCGRLEQPSLIVAYIGAGFIIPALAFLLFLYNFIKKIIRRKILERKDYENIDDSFSDDEDGATARPHLDKIKALVLAKENQSWVTRWIGQAVSPQTKQGQIMMTLGMITATLSLICYLGTVSVEIPGVELCGVMPNGQQILDFFCNIFLLFYLIVRLVGSEKKMKVLLDTNSLIDYFCIPAVLIQLFLGRYFVGFTFLRSYNFMWLVEVLANRNVFKTVNGVKLTSLVLLVVITLIVASGFLHLVENIGDFYPIVEHNAPYNGQSVSFWRCFLYLYGKVCLIDLSGIRVATKMGKLIIYAFQLIALGIIGRAIPQIIALLRITPEYDKDYIAPERFLHIILSGHVTTASASAFLKEFYHPDRDISEHFRVVILNEHPPDEQMERLLKQYFNRVDYRRGSTLSLMDLNRVKLFEAAATLLVADKTAAESDAEDAVNIMRVVSIKNFKDDARVIVQLLQYHNKAYLQNMPSWSIQSGDIVICIAELRLGLLAQSCYAPGFSTMVANFFTTRSFNENKRFSEEWLMDYARGTSLEMYARRISDAFVGMTFTAACEFCYLRLKIVLVAVKTDIENLATMPRVNPSSDCVLNVGSVGYFIADSTEEVERATYYCANCHRDLHDPALIKKCACTLNAEEDEDNQLLRMVQKAPIVGAVRARDDLFLEGNIWSFIRQFPASPDVSVKDGGTAEEDPDAPTEKGDEKPQYDSTGMFHWCKGRPIESVMMNRMEAAKANFSGHIVVAIMSTPNSQLVGLHSFILPLRASVVKTEDLADVVILCDNAFIRKEWQYIRNLPRIRIVRGTALNRADLRSISLNTCRMCVILGAPSTGAQMIDVDNALIDKGVILATLNVRAMRFSEEEVVELPGTAPPSDAGSGSETSSLYEQKKSLKMRARRTGYEVPVITDLIRDTNAQFLDQDDDDKPGTEFYMTQPYACGRAFSGSALDLLMVTSFFNPVMVNVFRTMIFGGASLELEKCLAEGAGLIGGDHISKPANLKNQVMIHQFPVSSGPLSVHAESTYGGLFVDALVTYGSLCLGVYRKVDPGDTMKAAKRFVITNPQEDFILDPTDLVFSLERPESYDHDKIAKAGLTAFLSKREE